MITDKDERKHFIKECKDTDYYRKKIVECDEKLEVLNAQLEGVSSPTVKEVIYENARNPYQERKNILLTEEEKIVAEKNSWESRVNYVEEKLKLITNERDLNLITDLYIKEMNHEVVAYKYHYASRSALYKHVNKVLDKILKESTM